MGGEIREEVESIADDVTEANASHSEYSENDIFEEGCEKEMNTESLKIYFLASGTAYIPEWDISIELDERHTFFGISLPNDSRKRIKKSNTRWIHMRYQPF